MSHKVLQLPVSEIRAGTNDRTVFDKTALRELADSIAERGLLQPINVRRIGDHYQIIAGERRFRAAQLLKWSLIPGIVIKATDEEASALMLLENTARKDLDPIDEALAYDARVRLYSWDEKAIAKAAGVSVSRVRGRLKLVGLCDLAQKLVRGGQLPLAYAEILAEAKLTEDRQLQALRTYNAKSFPSQDWFKTLIAEMMFAQTQQSMFDDEDLLQIYAAPDSKVDESKFVSPLKSKVPASVDRTPDGVLEWHRKYWEDCEKQWTAISGPGCWFAIYCQMARRVLDELTTDLENAKGAAR